MCCLQETHYTEKGVGRMGKHAMQAQSIKKAATVKI